MNLKDQYTLLQSDQQGFVTVMKNFTDDLVKGKINDFAHLELVEKMNPKPQQKPQQLQEALDSVKDEIDTTFMLHSNCRMLSQKGELILLASVVIDSIPENMTIFDDEDMKDTDKSQDDHSMY